MEANIAKRQQEREESVALAEKVGQKLDESRREYIGPLTFQQLRGMQMGKRGIKMFQTSYEMGKLAA